MKIYQKKISKDHNDSYFYQGLIATKGNLELIACGEIKMTCNCDPQNDKEVEKCYQNDHFSLNNWFEVIDKRLDCGFNELVYGNYDDGLSALQDKEVKKYWDEEYKDNK